jgi:hypothetical protein
VQSGRHNNASRRLSWHEFGHGDAGQGCRQFYLTVAAVSMGKLDDQLYQRTSLVQPKTNSGGLFAKHYAIGFDEIRKMPCVVWDKGAQYKASFVVKFQSVVKTWRVRIYPLDSQLTL